MQDFMQDCDLFDMHATFGVDTQAPSTCHFGPNKVDHCLATWCFLQAKVGATMLSWKDSLGSDHKCLLVDCDANLLGSSENNDLTHPEHRVLVSNSKKKAQLHIDTLKSLMDNNNLRQ